MKILLMIIFCEIKSRRFPYFRRNGAITRAGEIELELGPTCLLYTSDAADE